MALFKIYSGTTSEFPSDYPLHEGFAYFFEDSGEFVIDTANGRVTVNSSKLVKVTDDNGIEYIEFDDIVTTDDIIDLAHGGTGATSSTAARTNLSVYSKAEVDTKVNQVTTTAYTTTLSASNWLSSGDNYVYNYANTNLTCGKAGNVPPIVTCTNNQDEYNQLDSAEATAGTGISFYASTKPESDIDIIIIDNR